MAINTNQANLRLTKELLAEIKAAQEEWQKNTGMTVTNSEFIRFLIKQGMKSLEK